MRIMASIRIPDSLFFAALMALPSIAMARPTQLEDKAPYHIAVVAPLSGPSAETGRNMVSGAKLIAKQINAEGGIDGHRINLTIHDDAGSPGNARAVAEEIVRNNQSIAVLGHWYSVSSIAAGPIYRDAHIAAVSPGSMSPTVTENNPWMFTTIHDLKISGNVLTYYLQSILGLTHIAIAHEASTYGQQLADVMTKTGHDIGIQTLHITTNPNSARETAQRILQTLSTQKEFATLMIATTATEGAHLVRALRDEGFTGTIVGSATFSEDEFLNALSGTSTPARNAAYYSHGIYAIAPLLMATAGPKAHAFSHNYRDEYGLEPGWPAAYAADTLNVIVEAIRRSNLNTQTLQEQRTAIHKALAGMNSASAGYDGITGVTYFTATGSAAKPPVIGRYRDSILVPAPVQLTPVNRAYAITDTPSAGTLVVDNLLLRRTEVVFSGIEMIRIDNIKPWELTFDAEFFLWFRYDPTTSATDIEFTNAVGNVVLGDPIRAYNTHGLEYRLYRVRGSFRAKSLAYHNVLGIADLPIRFRHRSKDHSELIYAVDQDTSSHAKDDILSPASRWVVNTITSYQDIEPGSGLGAPSIDGTGSAGTSVFAHNISVKAASITLGSILPGNIPQRILPIALFLWAIAMFARRPKRLGTAPVWSLILLVASALVSLATAEVAFIRTLAHSTEWTSQLGHGFEILWWLVPTLLLHAILNTLVWDVAERRTGHAVPTTMRMIMLALLLTFAAFGILAFVFNQKVTSLLATSGVVAMVVGLAVQVNISNIVSGLVLNLEKPFKIGDWVQVGDAIGRVVDINWRATRLHTLMDNVVSIPNAKVADMTVINYHYPTYSSWYGFNVFVDHHHDPSTVKKILEEAILAVPTVSEPWVVLASLNEWSADYGVYYRSTDYARKVDIQHQVWTSIWEHLSKAGIKPAVRKQQVQVSQVT